MRKGNDNRVCDPDDGNHEDSNALVIECDTSKDNRASEFGILLPQNNFSLDENIVEKKKCLLQKFIAALDKCSSNQELDALENFVSPMEPTLNAIKLKSSGQISDQKGSQGSSRKIESQKRFEKPPKKRKQVNRKQRSYLAEELFNSQQTVQFDHDY